MIGVCQQEPVAGEQREGMEPRGGHKDAVDRIAVDFSRQPGRGESDFIVDGDLLNSSVAVRLAEPLFQGETESDPSRAFKIAEFPYRGGRDK